MGAVGGNNANLRGTRVFSIRDYGAVGDGKTKDETAAAELRAASLSSFRGERRFELVCCVDLRGVKAKDGEVDTLLDLLSASS